MFLFFSHSLNEKQIEEAKEKWGVEEFVVLPDDLQDLWSNIPSDLPTIAEILLPLKKFLQQQVNRGDIVLVQGDFGATYQMVCFAKSLKLTVVYATTMRDTIEIQQEDGKIIKKSIFEHGRFREYE